MAQSEEERFVEKWISDHVGADGYEAGREKASSLEAKLLADAKDAGFTREKLEAEVGDLTERLHLGLTAATENAMMDMDERSGSRSVELPVGQKEEALEAEAARADRQADE